MACQYTLEKIVPSKASVTSMSFYVCQTLDMLEHSDLLWGRARHTIKKVVTISRLEILKKDEDCHK